MANLIFPKPWHSSRIKATDEKNYFNRRQILKQLGLATGGLLTYSTFLSSCNSTNAAKTSDGKGNTFSFPGMEEMYPAKRNEKYTLDRPMTKEYDATHYNNFYEFINPQGDSIYTIYQYVDPFDTSDWTFKVSGQCSNKGTFELADIIKKIGLEERTYRFRCVERWAMAVPWTGFPFAKLIEYLQPTSKAKYIKMVTASKPKEMIGIKNQPWYPWPYQEALRLDEGMNELTFIATGLYGKPLPKQNGAPMRLVVPWKYGYKNVKSIVSIEFTEKQPKTFWNELAPNEYPFISNIDPYVPHPRWSQAEEWLLPDGDPRPTLKYNGYGEYVASLYK